MKQNVYANAAKLRCKKLAWMIEPEWEWWIVHTDHMSVLRPKTTPQSSYLKTQVLTAMGFDELANEANGPNNESNSGHHNATT